MNRPVCYLDVDGVVNTVVPNEETGQEFEAEGFRICVPRGLAERVARLEEAFDMVWATTWGGRACEHISPMVGFGKDWPVLGWMKLSGVRGYHASASKLPNIVDHADGRDWVFIDDDAFWEIGELLKYDYSLSEQMEGRGRYMTITPETRVGLEDRHVEEALEFAAGA